MLDLKKNPGSRKTWNSQRGWLPTRDDPRISKGIFQGVFKRKNGCGLLKWGPSLAQEFKWKHHGNVRNFPRSNWEDSFFSSKLWHRDVGKKIVWMQVGNGLHLLQWMLVACFTLPDTKPTKFVGWGLEKAQGKWLQNMKGSIWSNDSDLTRPHPKWWFSKGNPLISPKSGLEKYYHVTR